MSSCNNPCKRDSYQPKKGTNCGAGTGMFFNELPLAMAYVPMQMWRDIYQPHEAFHAGTIFRELVLPFYGRRVCK